jgi:hypothetical protein
VLPDIFGPATSLNVMDIPSLPKALLSSAVRSLEESATLELPTLAEHREDDLSVHSFRNVSRDRQEHASIIRAMLLSKNKSNEIVAP